jgi:hypothetical protein
MGARDKIISLVAGIISKALAEYAMAKASGVFIITLKMHQGGVRDVLVSDERRLEM